MSAEQPPAAPALGESWVMTPTASSEKKEVPGEPRPKISKGAKTATPSESLSASWESGPELVMPSICETPNPEGSWVEYVRTPKQSGSESTRKRRKVSSPSTKLQQAHAQKSVKADAGSSAKIAKASKPTLGINTALVRGAINTLLIALILHLLVLPELVHQARDLCLIPSVKSLYASSCSVPYAAHHPNQSTASDLTTSQTNLQSILTTTLTTLTPLSSTLKESETILTNLSAHLKSTIPDARHALDLEFTGSDQALQTAIWEFDSLRTDLRSALESLLSPTQSSVAIHLRRRSEYLERLRAQIRSKAESLNTRFSTLDDHLEAVGIVAREHTISHGESYSVLDSLPFGSWIRGSSGDAEESSARPATLALVRGAAAHHRAVADSVLWLSRQLGST
ncbi:hypothetical protein N7452_000584 [Penicillium brevicompactum]|uniref:Uncharacterized protein n=1 Tax=Penicillium brevicompactum TaxID=5074 RepID=A0A9W9UQC2_PENBR|nr:hypothetical protein N7452_000584 [Penicillium brevicompactum]